MKKKVIINSEYDTEYQEKIETFVLGSILLDREVMHQIATQFEVKLFSKEENIAIANGMVKLHVENKPIDLLTLVEQLKKDHQLDNAGGILNISNLTSNVLGAGHLEYHLRLLQQYWLARYINESCQYAQMQILEYKEDVFDVYANLQRRLDEATNDLVKKDLVSVEDIHLELMKKSYENLGGNSTSGVPTGLIRLDTLTNGFQNSDLIILAGRTSMGKTAFAVSILIEPVIRQKIPVAFFSLEMSKEQVVGRVQSILSKVNVSKIVKKQLSYDEIDVIYKSCLGLSDAPLFIDDTANISLMELKTKARKMVRENGVKMIVVDYLQLMRSGMKTTSREQEVAEISKGLKAIAKELNIPVIALSQLSRNVEQRGGSKTPMLSDLRDSGQIEQDADLVLFCYRPEYYNLDEYDWFGINLETKNLFMLIVAKHRNGVLGEIPLNFYGEFTQIDNHFDNYRLYPNEINSSKLIPLNAINSSKLIPQINVNSSIIKPENSNFENEKGSAILPLNNINDSMRLPYKDNDDISELLDNPPF
jgi:replicative DNA helicase